MKKTILSIVMASLLLCSSCTFQKVTVTGTWYSVTDSTMYNFSDGKITVSGVVVGQYEDKGDSIVVSLIDSNENLQLYITSLDGIDVLADVRDGDGSAYFCKGLENADAIRKAAMIAQEKDDEAGHTASMSERARFDAYLKDNLFGVWVSDNPNKNVVKMEFSNDAVTITDKWGNVTTEYILADPLGRVFPVVTLRDGIPEAELYISENKDGTDAGYIFITLTDETYTENRVEIYSWTFTKQ